MANEQQHATLLDHLRSIEGVEHADLWSPAEGCYAIRVQLDGTRYLMATVAVEHEGRWLPEPELPHTEDGPWLLGYYPDDEADPVPFAPLNRDQLLTQVAALAKGGSRK